MLDFEFTLSDEVTGGVNGIGKGVIFRAKWNGELYDVTWISDEFPMIIEQGMKYTSKQVEVAVQNKDWRVLG